MSLKNTYSQVFATKVVYTSFTDKKKPRLLTKEFTVHADTLKALIRVATHPHRAVSSLRPTSYQHPSFVNLSSNHIVVLGVVLKIFTA